MPETVSLNIRRPNIFLYLAAERLLQVYAYGLNCDRGDRPAAREIFYENEIIQTIVGSINRRRDITVWGRPCNLRAKATSKTTTKKERSKAACRTSARAETRSETGAPGSAATRAASD